MNDEQVDQEDESSDTGLSKDQRRARGHTLRPVWIGINKLETEPPLSMVEYAREVRRQLEERRKERVRFYQDRMRQYDHIFDVRDWLARLGAAALVASALAAAARFLQADGQGYDKLFLVASIICLAGMSALVFYERSTTLSRNYFRQIGILLAFRDIWTKFQFRLLAEVRAAAGADAAGIVAAKDRILLLAENTWNEMEALSSAEQKSWEGEFLETLSQLATNAGKMQSDVDQRFREAGEAEKARRATAFLKLTIEGQFKGKADVVVDGKVLARTELPTVALPAVEAGIHLLSVTALAPDDAVLSGTDHVDLKAGIQSHSLTLTRQPLQTT